MLTNQILNYIYNNHETMTKLNAENISYYMCKYRRLSKTTLTKYPKDKIINALNNLYIFTVGDDNVNELSEEIHYIISRLMYGEYDTLFYNGILSITLSDTAYNTMLDFLPKTVFDIGEDIVNGKVTHSLEISLDENTDNKIYDLCGFNIDVINEFHKFNSGECQLYDSSKMEDIIDSKLFIIFDSLKKEELLCLSNLENILEYLFKVFISYIDSVKNNDESLNEYSINGYLSIYILIYNRIIDTFNESEYHQIYRIYLKYIAKTSDLINKTETETDKYFALMKLKNILMRSADKIKGVDNNVRY